MHREETFCLWQLDIDFFPIASLICRNHDVRRLDDCVYFLAFGKVKILCGLLGDDRNDLSASGKTDRDLRIDRAMLDALYLTFKDIASTYLHHSASFMEYLILMLVAGPIVVKRFLV